MELIPLCSESAGSILTLCFASNGTTTGPPAIRVSLLARAISLPALMAATVGSKPFTANVSASHAKAIQVTYPTSASYNAGDYYLSIWMSCNGNYSVISKGKLWSVSVGQTQRG